MQSDTNEPLEGAEVEVFNSDGDSVYTGTTDSNGEFIIVEIPKGEYTFKETIAPAGYTLSASTYSFSIDKEVAKTDAVYFEN